MSAQYGPHEAQEVPPFYARNRPFQRWPHLRSRVGRPLRLGNRSWGRRCPRSPGAHRPLAVAVTVTILGLHVTFSLLANRTFTGMIRILWQDVSLKLTLRGSQLMWLHPLYPLPQNCSWEPPTSHRGFLGDLHSGWCSRRVAKDAVRLTKSLSPDLPS